MKRKSLLFICFFEAILLTILILLTKFFPNIFSSMMAFPFEQLADMLNLLSKSGPIGNGISMALWFGISTVPAILALRCKRSRETLSERISLYVLSGILLLTLYSMVNPGILRPVLLKDTFESTKLIKAVFGVSIWAVIVLYMILHLVRLFRMGNKEQLLKYLRMMLYALCFLFTAAATVSLVGEFVSLQDVSQTGIDRIFGMVHLAAEFIPFLFDIVIIQRVLDLLDFAARDGQDGIVEAARRVSRVSCSALVFIAAIPAIFNIVQIAAMRWLSDISVTVDIPVISIVFVVLILLFSQLLIENKRLRDDNSLFI